MTIQVKDRFGLLLLILFSAVTALGSFNPFGSYNLKDMGNASSPIILLIQGLFIVYLFFYRGSNKFIKSQAISLCWFAAVWLFSSIIFATNIPQSFWINFVKLLLCIVLYCKLPLFIRDNQSGFRWTLLVFSITMAIIATLFISGLLNPYVVWRGGRALIFAENPNSTSTRMCFAMLFLFYLIYENPFKWKTWRFALFGLWIPLMFAILASGSRGSFIVIIGCMVLYLWYLPTKNSLSKYAFISLCTVGIILLINSIMDQNSDFTIFDRLNDTVSTGNDAGRTELSAAALQIFKNNFLLGVGAPEFTHIMLDKYGLNHTVHNNYWYVLATSGIVGFVFYGLFLVRLFWKSFFCRKTVPFAIVLVTGMLLIGSKSGGALAYIPLWYVFALATSLMLTNKKI